MAQIRSHLDIWHKTRSQGDPQTNLDMVWSRIQDYTAMNVKCRFNGMKTTMFTNGPVGYAKLKGKAAQVRGLTKVFLAIWAEGMAGAPCVRGGSVCWQTADVDGKLLLEGSKRLDDALHDNRSMPKLPPDVAHRFLNDTFLYAQLQTKVSNWGGLKLFNVTMKVRIMIHVVLLAGHVNPAYVCCFKSEDYMSKVKNLIVSCCWGVPLQNVVQKVVGKILHAMHYELAGRVNWM